MATEISSSLPFFQVIQKSAASLNELQQTRTEVLSQLAVIEAESHRLAAQRNQRVVEASKVAETIKTHLGDVLARLYAQQKLTEGTLSPSIDIAIEEAREQMAKVVKEEQAIRERHAQANSAETGLVDQAEAQSLTLHQRLRDIESAIQAVTQVKADAVRQQGLALLNDFMRQRDEMLVAIETTRKTLREQQEELDEVMVDGLDKLAPWPDLRHHIQQQSEIDDSTTHVLRAALTLLDVVMREGNRADSPILSQVLPTANLAHILSDLTYNIAPSLYGNTQPGTIDRKMQLERLLQGYIETRRRQL